MVEREREWKNERISFLRLKLLDQSRTPSACFLQDMQLHALTRVRDCSLVSKGTCTWAAGGHEGKDGSKPALFSSPGQYTIQNNRASIIGDDRGRIALSWSGLTAVLEVVAATDLHCVTRAKSRVPLCTTPYLIIADAVAAGVSILSTQLEFTRAICISI